MPKETSKVVDERMICSKMTSVFFQVLDTVGAAAVSLTGADLTVDNMIALLKVLREAEQRIQEITQSRR